MSNSYHQLIGLFTVKRLQGFQGHSEPSRTNIQLKTNIKIKIKIKFLNIFKLLNTRFNEITSDYTGLLTSTSSCTGCQFLLILTHFETPPLANPNSEQQEQLV